MKRLFAVVKFGTKIPVDGKYFEKKPEAKAFRDSLNKEEPGPFCVTLGPDHIHFRK